MTFDEIRCYPTTVIEIPIGSKGVHESCLRSYHILNKVVELITDKSVSRDMMLDLIKMMKTNLPKELHLIQEDKKVTKHAYS